MGRNFLKYDVVYSLHGTMDGVFLFEDVAVEDNKTMQGYDAIVVEQWTVLKGVEVQTDYVPLLNSLAMYGWQLTCVLPTPIVKTNREGNLSTKQIVFLQRPSLPQKAKKKESKFHWRFSKEDMHNKPMKKSRKTKLSSGEKQTAEKQEFEVTENTRNLAAQLSATSGPGPEHGVSEDRKTGQVKAGKMCFFQLLSSLKLEFDVTIRPSHIILHHFLSVVKYAVGKN
uniref:Raftlin n=1 Tax=Pavo cristatus TaxID=9049 RepID=A0A8C9FVW5_PAVCR